MLKTAGVGVGRTRQIENTDWEGYFPLNVFVLNHVNELVKKKKKTPLRPTAGCIYLNRKEPTSKQDRNSLSQ